MDLRVDYEHVIMNIASDGDPHMSYHEYRFAKHTHARIAWKLLAMFPEIEYYLGGSRAAHLRAPRNAQWCNQRFKECVEEVCLHEFGSVPHGHLIQVRSGDSGKPLIIMARGSTDVT
jgi:hypothetical protein